MALARESVPEAPTLAEVAALLDRLPILASSLDAALQRELRAMFDALQLDVVYQPAESALDVAVTLNDPNVDNGNWARAEDWSAPPAGLEPAWNGLEVRRLIHSATGASKNHRRCRAREPARRRMREEAGNVELGVHPSERLDDPVVPHCARSIPLPGSLCSQPGSSMLPGVRGSSNRAPGGQHSRGPLRAPGSGRAAPPSPGRSGPLPSSPMRSKTIAKPFVP